MVKCILVFNGLISLLKSFQGKGRWEHVPFRNETWLFISELKMTSWDLACRKKLGVLLWMDTILYWLVTYKNLECNWLIVVLGWWKLW